MPFYISVNDGTAHLLWAAANFFAHKQSLTSMDCLKRSKRELAGRANCNCLANKGRDHEGFERIVSDSYV